MTLGEKIKELRIKSNLTQEQLAEELDLSSYITRALFDFLIFWLI